MWEGQPVWCPQYPPAISRATSAGEAWHNHSSGSPAAAMGCRALWSWQPFSWALGQMWRRQKVQSLPQRACVSGLHPALAPSLSRSVPQHCSAVSQPAASALLIWPGEMGGVWAAEGFRCRKLCGHRRRQAGCLPSSPSAKAWRGVLGHFPVAS